MADPGLVPVEAPKMLAGSALPHRLKDLPEPPSTVFMRGQIPRGPVVAIVGTRKATRLGMRFAEALSHDLTRAGVSVFSGGAEGIDTAAHRGALRAGGTTVVVAPAGFARPFPEKNAALFRKILRKGGAYLSLVPDDVPASRSSFFARNGCLVALAHVLVIVEAGFISGAMNAAKWARELGRPRLVVPHPPWAEKGKGCLIELRRGAHLCEGLSDVLKRLDEMLLLPVPLSGDRKQARLPFETPNSGLGADSERVRDAIAGGAEHLDDVVRWTGLSASAIQRQILTLTLDGVLAPDPAGRLRLAHRADPGAVETARTTEERSRRPR